MYSAAMAPAFSRQPKWFRWVAPFILIDQVFALTSARTSDAPDRFRSYYLTCGTFFFAGWQVVTLLGIFFGSLVPDSWGLGFAPGVMFAGIVVLMLDRRPSVVAAVVAAVVCFAALGLPNRSGLLVGAVSGILAGFVADRSSRPEPTGEQ
jgi:predicted branched-subunit amino acid permease